MSAPWKQQPDDVLKHWLFSTLYQNTGLTEWERGFLISVDRKFHQYGRITERQQEILERIYAEKTK